MTPRHIPAAFVGVLLAASLGCASTSGAGGPSSPDILLDADRAAEATAEVLADASPTVRRVLADGVTLPEYRAAVGDAASCYERGVEQLAASRGLSVNVDVGPVEDSADDYEASTTYQLDLRSVPAGTLDEATIEAARRIEADCAEQRLEPVERSYQIERLADPSFAQSVAVEAAKCLRAAGFSRSEAVPAELQESIKDRLAERDVPVDGEVAECLEEFPAVTDLPLVEAPSER